MKRFSTTLTFLTYCLFISQLSYSAEAPISTELPISAEPPIVEETILIPESLDSSSIMVRESNDNPMVQIETSMGNLILELFPEEAPVTVENFLGLVEGTKEFVDPNTGELVTRPFYDGLIFHRVLENFMIQGGSPTGLGNGEPGYSFKDEINARSLGLDKMMVIEDDGEPHPFLAINTQADFQKNILGPLYQTMGITSQEELETNVDEVDERIRAMTVKQSYENLGYQYTETVNSRMPLRGVIAMANSGPNTNGSQFFINLVDTQWLAGKHTVFGKVRVGMSVLDSIANVAVDTQAKPYRDIVILSIRKLEE